MITSASIRSGPARWWLLAALALVGGFARPLWDLVRFALHSDLYSHILLMPVLVGYLVRIKGRELVWDGAPARGWALLPFVMGLSLLAGYGYGRDSGWVPALEDYLAVMMGAFLCWLAALALVALPGGIVRQLAFPAGLLLFLIPFPRVCRAGIETFFQYGSADAAHLFFQMCGMPVLRRDLEFHLPGFALQIAPECSGIHSSLVLFITSLVAGYLFLAGPWRRAVLTAAVLPLALLRNGFRVFVLGELCVNVSPDMIHSPIHHQGGPLFFALSLIPFFFLLFWLRRGERRRSPPPAGGG